MNQHQIELESQKTDQVSGFEDGSDISTLSVNVRARAQQQPRGAKVTEQQLEDLVMGLFKKHDSNQNLGIDVGIEFDNFLQDWYPYAKGVKSSSVSRDQLREMVQEMDLDNNGVVSFEEFWPYALKELHKSGRIVQNKPEQENIGFQTPRTNNRDQFESDVSIVGDQALPSVQDSPDKAKKLTEGQLEIIAKQLFFRHDENKNGAIDWGLEFDGLLYDTFELLGDKKARQTLGRDELQSQFKLFNTDVDEQISFKEYWNFVYSRFVQDGRIIMPKGMQTGTFGANREDQISAYASTDKENCGFSDNSGSIMAGDQGTAPLDKKETIKTSSILGSSMDNFRALLLQFYNECRPSEDGLSKQGVSNFKQRLIRRLQDEHKGSYEEMQQHVQEINNNMTTYDVNNADDVTFEDLFLPLSNWWVNHARYDESPSPVKKQMSESQFKNQLHSLFQRHDDNKSGGIEVGQEFDNFLSDYMNLIQEQKNVPRDEMRESFKGLDINGDQKITYEEILPQALQSAEKKRMIKHHLSSSPVKTSQTPSQDPRKQNLSGKKRTSHITMISQNTANDFNEFDSTSELILSDQALPGQEEVKTKVPDNPSILELPLQKFQFAIKKIISHIDQKKANFLNTNQIAIFKRTFYRWLQQDPKKFPMEVINRYIIEQQKIMAKKIQPDGSILVIDLLATMMEWHIVNKEKKSNSPSRLPLQVSELTLKKNTIDLFKRHDENNNGGIDFGAEFDNFLFDLAKVLWPDGSMAHASRDQMRQVFMLADKDNDRRFSFDEIWDTVLQIANKTQLIKQHTGLSLKEKMLSDQPDAIMKARMAGFGKKEGSQIERKPTQEVAISEDRSDSGIFEETNVQTQKQTLAKQEAVSDFSCNDRSREDEPEPKQNFKITAKTTQKSNSYSEFSANDRSDTVRQPVNVQQEYGTKKSKVTQKTESYSEFSANDRSESEHQPIPRNTHGNQIKVMEKTQSYSEFSANDRDETIRQTQGTKQSVSPERSFKNGDPLSHQQMRRTIRETLNNGAAPRDQSFESLDQSRDEDIYALTPSVQDRHQSTLQSKGNTLSQSRKSKLNNKSPTQENRSTFKSTSQRGRSIEKSPSLSPDKYQQKFQKTTDYALIKQKIGEALCRIYKKASMNDGVETCHRVISANNNDRQFVRVMLQLMTDKDLLPTEREDKFFTGAAMHAAMFGYLAKTFKENMVNPLDRTREKTYERILNYMFDAFFSYGEDIVANGCAISMIEVLENCFPELADENNQEASQKFFQIFLVPLLTLLQGGVGTAKTAVKSAAFCLRRIVQHLIKKESNLLQLELVDGLVEILIRGKVTETDYNEMMRDIIKVFNNDLISVFDANLLTALQKNISTINTLTNNSQAGKIRVATANKGETRSISPHRPLGHIPGKQLEDLVSAIRLQRMIVDNSSQFAQQVVYAHYQSAQEALSPMLTKTANKLGKLQTETTALRKAWERLKEIADKQHFERQPAGYKTLPQQNKGIPPSSIFNKKMASTNNQVQRKSDHIERIRSNSGNNRAQDLKPYGNPMVTGKEDFKKPEQPKKKKNRPFEFEKTAIEEIKLRPNCDEFLKKGEGVGGGAKPIIDDGSPIKKTGSFAKQRPATAAPRPAKEQKRNELKGKEDTSTDLNREFSPKNEVPPVMKDQMASLQAMLLEGFDQISQKMSQMEERLNQSENLMQQSSNGFQQQLDRNNFKEMKAQIQIQQRKMMNMVKQVGGEIQPKKDNLKPHRAKSASQSRSPTPNRVMGQTINSGSQPKRLPRLTRVWHKATEFVKKRNFEQAYRLILTEGDDIYLLRLVAQTGQVIRFLQQDTARAVLSRINKIVRRGVFEAIEVEWIDEAYREGLFQKLSQNEQNEYLDTLYQLTNSTLVSEPVVQRACETYQSVKRSILRQNQTMTVSNQAFYPQYMQNQSPQSDHLPPLLHQMQPQRNSRTTKFTY